MDSSRIECFESGHIRSARRAMDSRKSCNAGNDQRHSSALCARRKDIGEELLELLELRCHLLEQCVVLSNAVRAAVAMIEGEVSICREKRARAVDAEAGDQCMACQ